MPGTTSNGTPAAATARTSLTTSGRTSGSPTTRRTTEAPLRASPTTVSASVAGSAGAGPLVAAGSSAAKPGATTASVAGPPTPGSSVGPTGRTVVVEGSRPRTSAGTPRSATTSVAAARASRARTVRRPGSP